MTMYTYPDYMYHYGVIGMKWGQRKRYYNSDGSLNSKGQKKTSKAYKKNMRKYSKSFTNNAQRLKVEAYNKTADEYNKGKIKEFNKTHDSKSKSYMDDYARQFSKDFDRNYSKMLLSQMENNKYYKRAKNISDKYNMITYDDAVKNNEKFINELKRVSNS